MTQHLDREIQGAGKAVETLSIGIGFCLYLSKFNTFTEVYMRIIQVIILSFMLLLSSAAQAQAQPPGYPQFVVVYDVEVQYIRGELRFCERAHLRDRVCGSQQKLFGKKYWAVQDWWSPETYVQARTGLNEFTLWSVEPTPDGRGLLIRYSP